MFVKHIFKPKKPLIKTIVISPGGSTKDPGDLGSWLGLFFSKLEPTIDQKKTVQPTESSRNFGDSIGRTW